MLETRSRKTWKSVFFNKKFFGPDVGRAWAPCPPSLVYASGQTWPGGVNSFCDSNYGVGSNTLLWHVRSSATYARFVWRLPSWRPASIGPSCNVIFAVSQRQLPLPGSPWGLDFIPYPPGAESPYSQNPKIVHTHTSYPVSFCKMHFEISIFMLYTKRCYCVYSVIIITHSHGSCGWITQLKQQTSQRRYYLSAHWLHGDVLLSNSAFLSLKVTVGHFITNYIIQLAGEKKLKWVNIWQSYRQNGWLCHIPHSPYTFVLKYSELAR